MKPSTHYFKEAVVRDGVTYQHVIGLNEEYDWRLILDLSENPSWQFISLKRPVVWHFAAKKRGLFSRVKPCRCPFCRERLRDCEDRWPDGKTTTVKLPDTPRSFELWHDEETVCPGCGARVGICRPDLSPALPSVRLPRLNEGRKRA